MLKSNLNSAHQSASNGVQLFVISWKNTFWILLKKLANRQLYSSRLQQLKNYLCMFFRSGDIGHRQRINKNILRHKKTECVIINACTAYVMLNFVRRYLKSWWDISMLKSNLNSAHQSASNGVQLFVISWKNTFWILLKKLATRQLYSRRLQQLKNYLSMFFRSGDIGRLGIFYVKFPSTISQKVGEIFQLWKVIWTRLIKAIPTAHNSASYLGKIFL